MSFSAETINTEAIILRAIRFKESDRIVEALSPELGRFTFTARKALIPKSKISSGTEPLTHCHLQLEKKFNQYYLSQLHLENSFDGLKSTLPRLMLFQYLCEIFLKVSFPHEDSIEVFSFLSNLMMRWDRISHPYLSYPDFHHIQTQLLGLLGIVPLLHQCCHCGKKPDFSLINCVLLSFNEGGLVCSKCLSPYSSVSKIPLETFHYLQFLFHGNNDIDLQTELIDYSLAGKFLDCFLEFHLHLSLLSRKFIQIKQD